MALKKPLRVGFLLLPLPMFLTGFTADADRPWERVGTFVEDAVLQAVDSLTQRCPAPPKELCAYDYPVLREACEVRETNAASIQVLNIG